jgi:hypothetical protein
MIQGDEPKSFRFLRLLTRSTAGIVRKYQFQWWAVIEIDRRSKSSCSQTLVSLLIQVAPVNKGNGFLNG